MTGQRAVETRLPADLRPGDTVLLNDNGRERPLTIAGFTMIEGWPVIMFTDGTGVVVTDPSLPIMVTS